MKLLIHSQTSTVQYHPTLFWACDYLSLHGLKFNHVSEWSHWYILMPFKAKRQMPHLLNCSSMDSNYIQNKLWYKITYPFSDFNNAKVEVGERISNFIPHVVMHLLLIRAGIEVNPC